MEAEEMVGMDCHKVI